MVGIINERTPLLLPISNAGSNRRSSTASTVLRWDKEDHEGGLRTSFVEGVRSTFPFLTWLPKYNTDWFKGDLVAGITAGVVVIPQGMAYARLAHLPPEFGLYSSFVGVLIYWLFATSKDVTIGPVAVVSTLIGGIITKSSPLPEGVSAIDIAGTLALASGLIITLMGILQMGWIVEYIPLPVTAAFLTGSAIDIAIGQLPTLLGIPSISRGSAISTLLSVYHSFTTIGPDTIIGGSSLFFLYALRHVLERLGQRSTTYQKFIFFLATLRTILAITFFTLLTYIFSLPVSTLGPISSGLPALHLPNIPPAPILNSLLSSLPALILVLIIEHISIAKSFGRVHSYTIRPSQELLAIGITNILSPFISAYPSTGSFSRTAIKSKAGVRTPLSGLFTAGIVLIACYYLTHMFTYIPTPVMAAVIIHAVGDMIFSGPAVNLLDWWTWSPLESFIFILGIAVTVVWDVEAGIYFGAASSLIFLLHSISSARGKTHLLPPPQIDGPTEHADFIVQLPPTYSYPNASGTVEAFAREIKAATVSRVPLNIKGRKWASEGSSSRAEGSSLPELRSVTIDMSEVGSVDLTGRQALEDFRGEMERWSRGVRWKVRTGDVVHDW